MVDDGVGTAQHAGDLAVQVVQRVAVLGEDDELALPAGGVVHLRVVLEEFGQLVPLAVLARGHDGLGLLLQPLEDADLGFELGDGFRGRGVVDQVLFEGLLLLGVQIVIVLGDGLRGLGDGLTTPDAELFFAQPVFQPLTCGA